MRKTLTDVLARRVLEPVAGDLLLDLTVACGRQDMETGLEAWAAVDLPASHDPHQNQRQHGGPLVS